MLVFKNVYFKINKKVILNNLSLVIKRQEKVLLMGKSGSGKSTIFNLILKNLNVNSGAIYYENKNINDFSTIELNNYRQKDVIMIYQKDDLFDNLTVLDNLIMYYYEKDVIDMLRKANLTHLKNRKVYSLSGGERQRVAIIKACLSSCNILLCDEITSALDYKNASKMIGFVLKMFADKTIIFIAHDRNLFENKIDHYFYLEEHKISKDILINDINSTKYSKNTKKRKDLLLVSLLQGIRKIKLASLIIFVLTVISFYVSLNYQNIFDYFAYQSYSGYFAYDVLFIKDNENLDVNENNIFIDLSADFENLELIINGINFGRVKYLPFYNKKSYSPLVLTNSLLEMLNVKQIDNLKLSNNQTFENIDIIEENGMFSSPCAYYDIAYFESIHQSNEKENYVIVDYDFTSLDDRFTNNPLFEPKKENKPYLESNAYNDYLTYLMVFDSIKSIIDYFFVVVIVYSIISLVLLNVSIMKKEAKQIAILISRGYSNFQILLSYLISIVLYFLISLFSLFIEKKMIISLLLAAFIQLFSLLVSYFYIKSKPLHNLLKEETLC